MEFWIASPDNILPLLLLWVLKVNGNWQLKCVLAFSDDWFEVWFFSLTSLHSNCMCERFCRAWALLLCAYLVFEICSGILNGSHMDCGLHSTWICDFSEWFGLWLGLGSTVKRFAHLCANVAQNSSSIVGVVLFHCSKSVVLLDISLYIHCSFGLMNFCILPRKKRKKRNYNEILTIRNEYMVSYSLFMSL